MKLTLYQQHRAKWNGCTRCALHFNRNRMVFFRGKIPCDVLFVGEAPGNSENISGIPFDGPAGDLLNQIVAQVVQGQDIRCAFTNLVCCIPLDEDGVKTEEPEHQEIKACRPRLEEFITIAKPKLVVAVGSLAGNYLPTLTAGTLKVDIQHPAHILRQGKDRNRLNPQQHLMIRRAIITLANAVQELRGVLCSS